MILALDISSETGWATHGNGGVKYGSWKVPTDDWAEAHNALEDRIEMMLRAHPIRTVVIERPFSRGAQRDFLQWLMAAAHGVAIACERNRVEVAPSQWRKELWGFGKWSTEKAKAKAMSWCREQGFAPENDNQADALCILTWALQNNIRSASTGSTR